MKRTKTALKSESKELNLNTLNFAEIDKFKLDEEWIQQEKWVGLIGQEVAKARQAVDIAKSALEVKEAYIDKRIRLNPAKYGVDRVTEGAIGKIIVLKLDSEPEPRALIEAKYRLAILQAALDRLSARGKAISDLIYLHSIQYFASPKVPRNMSNEDIQRMKQDRIKGVRS